MYLYMNMYVYITVCASVVSTLQLTKHSISTSFTTIKAHLFFLPLIKWKLNAKHQLLYMHYKNLFYSKYFMIRYKVFLFSVVMFFIVFRVKLTLITPRGSFIIKSNFLVYFWYNLVIFRYQVFWHMLRTLQAWYLMLRIYRGISKHICQGYVGMPPRSTRIIKKIHELSQSYFNHSQFEGSCIQYLTVSNPKII